MKKMLIVCLGNICRSPTAEAVLRAQSLNKGIKIQIDSAGTINHHQGNKPDARAISAGEERGYSFSGIKSRGVTIEDFSEFDYILAADQENKQDLLNRCPAQYQYKIALFLAFAGLGEQVIPDPYYGGEQGFELVLDLLEEASENILIKLGSD